jgi:hypothetical protein
MTMRILITVVLFVVGFAACKGGGSAGGPQATPSPQASPGAEELADLKALLFADQSLEELLDMVEPTHTPPPNDPLTLFASSASSSRNNNAEDARKYLQQVLSQPDTETRIQLWAWKGLRKLGDRPPENVADKVQGVVCELHNEAGVGTLAAYADGRARWIGGQGAAIVWEVPGSDAGIEARIRKLLKAAEPLVKSAPLSDTHQKEEPKLDHFRVSILTYNGIRMVEVFGPEIERSQPIAQVLTSSVDLLDALSKKSEETKKEQK